VCVVRRHIRYIDDRSAIISDDFFDERIVRGTELAEPDDTTREDILKNAGYEQVYDVDEIVTRMPTPEEIERLEITPGTPVAEHIRTGSTRTNQAVRVMISIVPGDTLILEYKIPTRCRPKKVRDMSARHSVSVAGVVTDDQDHERDS